MKWWTKIGCILTGWNSEVLMQCSEASRCQLNKYASALLILIIVWSVTGFCFAQRYMGLPLWTCAMVSLLFVTIVIMIERQILLTNHKSFKLMVFRAIIAFVMAIVGSTIFDQTLFGKDIDKQMTITIEQQVSELTQKRNLIIESKLASIMAEKDSLEKVNANLQEEVNANPWIVQKTTTMSLQNIVIDGVITKVNNPSVTNTQVPNPKQEVIKSNNEKILTLSVESNEWYQKKQKVEETVRQECQENVGFLEELEAMWTIVMTRPLAGAFYLVFFVLLMSLELFVVVSKLTDRECDYETAILGSQRVRMAQFEALFSRVH